MDNCLGEKLHLVNFIPIKLVLCKRILLESKGHLSGTKDTQSAFLRSKPTMKTPEQRIKPVQSQQLRQ